MSEPCIKEGVLTTLQVKQAEIAGDVTHIKKRIDNGMTTKIDRVHDVVMRLEPIIDHHAKVVNNVEMMGWWLSRIVLTLFVGVLVWAIKNGFDGKL